MNQRVAKPGGIETVSRFSTDGIPRHKRAAHFREHVGNAIVKLDACPLSEDFCINGTAITLPNLGAVGTSITPSRISRTREVLRDGNDNLRLVILRRSASPAPAVQLGSELTVENGSAVVLSNCDLNGITFTASETRMISLNLTRKILRPLLRDFDTVLGHAIPKRIAPLRLLATYVEALLAEPAPLASEFGQLAVAHIYDLAALAMGATRDAAEIANNRGLAAARLREIKTDIAANLSRGNLSVGEIALRQRVTPRYVQMLFETEGTTFSEFVRNARLNKAHRMLADPRLADRSISVIALEAGFRDLSYFNKAFRRRFGSTPSDVRTARRNGA